MATASANPPLPEFTTDYVLELRTPEELLASVKYKQFIHIDQSECILCEALCMNFSRFGLV